MGERRGDTREQIRKVALELFAEQGYEKTSLREIAERLSVTKAALYYHFKTKEDIVSSLFADVHDRIEEIISWARTQPHTSQVRQEIVRRYAELIRSGVGGQLMRFMAENGPAVRDLKVGEDARERFMQLSELVSVEDAPLTDRLRARLSIFSLHLCVFLLHEDDISDDERHAAALEVALDLVNAQDASMASDTR